MLRLDRRVGETRLAVVGTMGMPALVAQSTCIWIYSLQLSDMGHMYPYAGTSKLACLLCAVCVQRCMDVIKPQ